MLRTSLTITVFLCLVVFAAAGQTSSPRASKAQPTEVLQKDDKDDEQENTKLPDEMRVRLEIARADAEHKKVVEDADKLNDLSQDVHKDYQQHGKLSSEILRKLGMIEKLAKKILTHAGGDQVEEKNAHEAPLSLSDAIGHLGSAAESIKKEMKTETRFVVSATVIAHSNEVIQLVQFIRHVKSD